MTIFVIICDRKGTPFFLNMQIFLRRYRIEYHKKQRLFNNYDDI